MPQPRACKEPGCYSLALPGKAWYGYCRPHYNQFYRTHYGRASDLRRRIKRRTLTLAKWMTRPHQHRLDFNRRPSPHPPPTPHQQRIYKDELNRLLTKYPPKSNMAYKRLCVQAAIWARAGGRARFTHQNAIDARKAGWRRKWLREGSYDPVLLESEIKRLEELQNKKIAKRQGKC